MHEAPKNLSEYRKEIDKALDDNFLRRTLDTFAVAYRANREAIFKEVDEKALIKQIADAKDDACKHMDELYEQFRAEAEKRGVHVYRAADAKEANEIIARIAKENDVKKIVKSKSMTAEEIQLNPYLEKEGFIVDETDLGEWIIQLRHEGPSHMVMPAIHLSRYQVADDFTKVTGVKQDTDVQRLVKVARVQLRRKFLAADMGVSGCNFAVAECGAVSTVTNEGNARMVTTVPRVHVAIAGLDKLVPTIDVALTALQVLPRNATAQRLTSYVTFIAGATECGSASDGKKSMHVVFLDNGRSEIAKDPLFSQIFRCVRCGACANVCPVFRLVGGHKMGYIYIGAIGLILTYFFHGKDIAKTQELVDELSERIKSILSKYENAIELLKEIPGFSTKVVEDLVAEIGLDMSHIPSEKHLASWAGVCPGNNESAGKKKWKNHSRKQACESGHNRSRMGSDPYQEYVFQ